VRETILKFLGLSEGKAGAGESGGAETETVRRIVDALDRLEPDRARYVAAFAYNLSRVAHADSKVSREETREMERIVRGLGGLPEEQAILVVQMAKTQALLFGGTENFLVTREFNRIATREQKLALLECLFAVSAADRSISTIEDNSAADRSISTIEDNEVRKISRELQLEHADFIAARSVFREHLAVLKKDPPDGKA
jgi:uncharacterized tellurite resistance protein B-like protein